MTHAQEEVVLLFEILFAYLFEYMKLVRCKLFKNTLQENSNEYNERY